MKAVARVVAVVVLMVFLPTDLAFSEVQKPVKDPEGCRNCTRNYYTRFAECGDSAEWGDPSNWVCVGGSRCWNTADGYKVCEANCGDRCYSI